MEVGCKGRASPPSQVFLFHARSIKVSSHPDAWIATAYGTGRKGDWLGRGRCASTDEIPTLRVRAVAGGEGAGLERRRELSPD